MRSTFILWVLSLVLLSNLSTLAQDSNSLAETSFLEAGDLYESADYKKALIKLEDTEKLLTKTNSKILYLKIKILNNLFKGSNSYYSPLNKSITDFFAVTNKSQYPAEKYNDIVRLKTDLTSFIKSDSLNSSKIIAGASLSDIDTYISSVPNTFYLNPLIERSKILNKEIGEYNKRNEIANREKELIDVNRKLKVAKKTNFNKRIWGAFWFSGGAALGIAAFTEKTNTKAETTGNIILGGMGFVISVLGITKFVNGNQSKVNELKARKKELEKLQKTISWQPFFQPSTGVVGISLSKSF